MLPVLFVTILMVSSCTAAPQGLKWSPLQPAVQLHQTMKTNDLLQFQPMTPFDEIWASFKLEHGKTYETPEEEDYRKEVFAVNLKKVEMHNYLFHKGLKSFTLGINTFADLETSEFTKRNGFRASPSSGGASYLSPNVKVTVPPEIDWRTKGYVTYVKNQGQCGSCWAFSATGSMEGQHFRASKTLVSLSEQNLVDCSRKEGNEGCNGGYMDSAFKYVTSNHGIDSEISYPYKAKDGTCHYNKTTVGATVTGFVDIVPSGDESKLMEATALNGPISVAIDASQSSFQLYRGGVYDEPECSSTSLDHGVLVVGYGTEGGIDYWLVKNSWGQKWGDAGYIKMSRNKSNQCGIATMASYPLV